MRSKFDLCRLILIYSVRFRAPANCHVNEVILRRGKLLVQLDENCFELGCALSGLTENPLDLSAFAFPSNHVVNVKFSLLEDSFPNSRERFRLLEPVVLLRDKLKLTIGGKRSTVYYELAVECMRSGSYYFSDLGKE